MGGMANMMIVMMIFIAATTPTNNVNLLHLLIINGHR